MSYQQQYFIYCAFTAQFINMFYDPFRDQSIPSDLSRRLAESESVFLDLYEVLFQEMSECTDEFISKNEVTYAQGTPLPYLESFHNWFQEIGKISIDVTSLKGILLNLSYYSSIRFLITIVRSQLSIIEKLQEVTPENEKAELKYFLIKVHDWMINQVDELSKRPDLTKHLAKINDQLEIFLHGFEIEKRKIIEEISINPNSA